MTDLASITSRLGYGAEETLLIISCDELGFCHSVNEASYALLRDECASSTTLLIAAPWSRAAAADYRGEDTGVELALIAELDRYRWGPLTHAPSLLDGDGAFPRTVDDVWEHADLDEVRREWRAQIERSVLWGFHVTHLAMHAEAIELKPEFFDVYLDLAEDFQLPIRLIGSDEQSTASFPRRALAAERGVLFPDTVTPLDRLGSSADEVADALGELGPGVHEIVAHVGIDTSELRAATPQWRARVDEYELLRKLDWERVGARRIGYGALATLMR
jgi:predicted glycoside hydrolase/deacetylase ChbG (UPF0249 family)